MDNLGQERKYNMMNRFSPKKLPARAVSRASITHIYSWVHYAPQPYFQWLNKETETIKKVQGGANITNVALCNYC
jgi:hypothetical protein